MEDILTQEELDEIEKLENESVEELSNGKGDENDE